MRVKLSIDEATRKKLDKALHALPDRAAAIGKGAANFAMTPVLKSAKSAVPKDRGALEESLVKKTKFYKKNGTTFVIIGPDKDFVKNGERPVKYAHLVELGVAAHTIEMPSGQIIQHPGYPPTPFLRSALIKNKSIILSRYIQKMSKNIDKEVKKLGRK